MSRSNKPANDGVRPISARYIFPASTRAAVHGMRMTIGNQVITAKIKERDAAQKQFDQAKSEGKSASLLKQQRPNVFSIDVANIMPGDSLDIELNNTELLVPTDGTYEFVYPTVVGPRYSSQPEASALETDRWIKSPYLPQGGVPHTRFNIAAKISAGMALQEVATPSHQTDIFHQGDSLATVALKDTETFSGNRDFLLRFRLTGKEIESGLMLFDNKDEKPVHAFLDEKSVDLIVLDIGLPDISGVELCKEIRKTHTLPIIFLTARTNEIDRVVGLEIGADDYVVKPFSPRELSARIKAVLRRTQKPSAAKHALQAFQIDETRRRISYFGTPVELSRYEYNLLKVLVLRPGHVLSRDRLMDLAWEEPEASMDRTVDAHVKTIRAKLKSIKPEIDPITTHRGIGYSLKEDL